jgi:tetratricopeptide (TPR) repeat protein
MVDGHPLVSLCMIVRNEGRHLKACLDSARGIINDIVVVDTGSCDDTRELARQCGARVYDFPWCDDFSAARNESVRHARGEWILWLDADDRVAERSRTALEKCVRSLPIEPAAYLFRVISIGPDGGPMFEVLHPRLFPNRSDVRWEYRVHEQVAPSLRRAGCAFRATDVSIVHVGYRQSDDVSRKLERNLRLLNLDLQRDPLDPFILSGRAGTLLDLGRSAEALVSLHLCEVAYAGHRIPPNIPALKARAYAHQGELLQALEIVCAGRNAYPRDGQLSFKQAEILGALGRLEDAEACLRGQLMIGEDHPAYGCADRTLAAFRVRHLLADVLLLQGRAQEAQVEAEQVTRERPAFGVGWLTLAETLLAHDRVDAARAICERFGQSRDADSGRSIVEASIHMRHGEPRRALVLIDRLLEDTPGNVLLRRARAQAMFASGSRGDAMNGALSQVLELDPLCARTWALRRQLSVPGRFRAPASLARCAELSLSPLVALE